MTVLRGSRGQGWRAGPVGRRLAAVAAGVAVLAAASIGAAALLHRPGSGSTASSANQDSASTPESAQPRLTATATGRDYTAPTLDAAVRVLVAGSTQADAPAPVPFGQAPDQRAAAPVLDRLRQPDQLQACVDELAGRAGTTPVTVDLGRYQGRPAAVVVLADPDPAKVQAWVVGAGCRAGQADLLRYQVVRRAG